MIDNAEFKNGKDQLSIYSKDWDILDFQDIFKKCTYGPRFNASKYNANGNVKTIRGTHISGNWEIKYEKVPLVTNPIFSSLMYIS